MGFIKHPDPSKSHFLKAASRTIRLSQEELVSLASKYEAITSLDEIKKINSLMIIFSDWLIRKRKTLTIEEVKKEVETIEKLTAAQEIVVWDNLFYQIITNSSTRIKDVLLAVITANNFITTYKSHLDAGHEHHLRKIACAKVIIPKSILSQIQVKNLEQNQRPNLEETSRNKEQIDAEITAYTKAKEELCYVNELFVRGLGSIGDNDPRIKKIIEEQEKRKKDTGAPVQGIAEEGVSQGSISHSDLIALVDNPLDPKNIKEHVSKETLAVIKHLDLHKKFKNPLKAISFLEDALIKANKEAFTKVKLSNKVVASGGSILKLSEKEVSARDSSEPCSTPTITGDHIVNHSNLNMISSVNTSGEWNTAGGTSNETISGDGTFKWSFYGRPRNVGNTAIGLSYSNPDHQVTSLKYGFKTYTIGLGGATVIAEVIVNGALAGGQSHVIHVNDVLKVARTGTLMRFYINDTVVHETIAENPDQPLVADLAFATYKSVVKDLCLKNDDKDSIACSGLTNLGVADYLRLEQEICCYVSGEVSHIENILQGEYKERSTRRLRRSETTTTFETEKTTEKLRDTSTTDRYEMESETSQIIQEDAAFDIGVNVTAKYGPVKVSVDSGYATATSSTEASSQAVSYGKEVTSRALERVVTRVREERVNKIIEEFEENNVHGLDNSLNTTGHVVGLYRWVDKIYKNQIVNYGKRMMLEFMIPEPAKFHLWAMSQEEVGITLEEPLDPRENGLAKHTNITEGNYASWAAAYGAKVDTPPAEFKTISKSYVKDAQEYDSIAKNYNDLTVPDGYRATSGFVAWSGLRATNRPNSLAISLGSSMRSTFNGDVTNGNHVFSDITEGTIAFSFRSYWYYSLFFNATVYCTRKNEILEKWQIETFNKIIEAYKEKKAAYDNALAEAKAKANLGIQINGNNPRYNRIIESGELKKACIQWLNARMGEDYYAPENVCEDAKDMPAINFEGELGCYAQQAKFFEQAFEWDIMSYLFYPYFWGKKCSWKEIYHLDDNDPIFRGFLQAGMARVIVPVRPNFEKAALYYLETGKVWNGGEVPTVDDDLYISIIDELDGVYDELPTKVGEPWETRMPTSLNILQKDAAGVDGDGLPCFCDDKSAEGTGGSKLEGGRDLTHSTIEDHTH